MIRRTLYPLMAALLLGLAGVTPAADRVVERNLISAGGAVNAEVGTLTLSGSLGQWQATGPATLGGSDMVVTGGFWAQSRRMNEWPALTGGWFDPATEGQGFNLQVMDDGLLGYFYGYDQGERMWLASSVYLGEFAWDEPIEVSVQAGAHGVFGDPVAPPDGIEPWGTLELTFHSCNSASALLAGDAGLESFALTRLAGVDGLGEDCTQPPEPSDSADISGAWFDPATDGQGWNLIATPFGLLAYFYGYTADGEPLWLVSANLPEVSAANEPVMLELLSARGGSLGSPVHPDDLDAWGEAVITFDDCEQASVELAGEDGSQTQSLVKLFGIDRPEGCRL